MFTSKRESVYLPFPARVRVREYIPRFLWPFISTTTKANNLGPFNWIDYLSLFPPSFLYR